MYVGFEAPEMDSNQDNKSDKNSDDEQEKWDKI